MAKSHRILLVEDNIDDEQLSVRALRRVAAGVEIAVARDGAEALALLTNGELELPDLVLLDLKLPKINGLEVLRRIRQHERTVHLFVIVLSSNDEPDDIRSVYADGACQRRSPRKSSSPRWTPTSLQPRRRPSF